MRSKKYPVAYYVLIVLVLAGTLIFAPAYRSALACEPTPVIPVYTPPTPIPLGAQVAGASLGAQIVLEGIVQSWVPASDSNSILTVQVEHYLKGHGPETVRIAGYFWECAPNFAFAQGSRAVFFVDGDPASAEPLQSRGWFASQNDVITSVRDATGQAPRAPDGTYALLWFSVPVIILFGLILFMRYRRARD